MLCLGLQDVTLKAQSTLNQQSWHPKRPFIKFENGFVLFEAWKITSWGMSVVTGGKFSLLTFIACTLEYRRLSYSQHVSDISEILIKKLRGTNVLHVSNSTQYSWLKVNNSSSVCFWEVISVIVMDAWVICLSFISRDFVIFVSTTQT